MRYDADEVNILKQIKVRYDADEVDILKQIKVRYDADEVNILKKRKFIFNVGDCQKSDWWFCMNATMDTYHVTH